jgi:hypothetical protein
LDDQFIGNGNKEATGRYTGAEKGYKFQVQVSDLSLIAAYGLWWQLENMPYDHLFLFSFIMPSKRLENMKNY